MPDAPDKAVRLQALPPTVANVVLRSIHWSSIVMAATGGLGVAVTLLTGIGFVGDDAVRASFGTFVLMALGGLALWVPADVATRASRLRTARGQSAPPPVVQREQLEPVPVFRVNVLVACVAVVGGLLSLVAVFYDGLGYSWAGLVGLVLVGLLVWPVRRFAVSHLERSATEVNRLRNGWQTGLSHHARPLPRATERLRRTVSGITGLLAMLGLMGVSVVLHLFGYRRFGGASYKVRPTIDPESVNGQRLQWVLTGASLALLIALIGVAFLILLHVGSVIARTREALGKDGLPEEGANVLVDGHWLRWVGMVVMGAGMLGAGLPTSAGAVWQTVGLITAAVGLVLIVLGEWREPELFNRILQAHPDHDFLTRAKA